MNTLDIQSYRNVLNSQNKLKIKQKTIRRHLRCFECDYEMGHIHRDCNILSSFICVKCKTLNRSGEWIEVQRLHEEIKSAIMFTELTPATNGHLLLGNGYVKKEFPYMEFRRND